MTEQIPRDVIVKEALSWLRTAYHHEGQVKIRLNPDGSILDRGGVDCAHFPYAVYRACGVIKEDVNIPHYSSDWFLHRDDERYLGIVLGVGREIDGPPLPGDFALWKIGRCYAHGGVLIAPQMLMHAFATNRMVIWTETFDPALATRAPRAFDMFAAKRA